MVKFIIWGTGKDANELMQENSFLRKETRFFIDNNKKVEPTFLEKRVFAPQEVELDEQSFIIVATTTYYDEIKEYLLKKGKIEGFDFINSKNYMFIDFINVWSKVSKYINLDGDSFKNIIFEYLSEDKNVSSILSKHMSSKIEEKESSARVEIFDLLGSKKYKFNEFVAIWDKASRWIPINQKEIILNIEDMFNEFFKGGKRASQILLEHIANEEEKTITFTDGTVFEYYQIHEFAITFEEILLNEDYYFETSNNVPFIIDGGANTGLAIYYFKKIYPNARIVAFEPIGDLYEVIRRNIERNNWNNVEVLNYALSDKEEEKTFFITESSLAGSLTKRNVNNASFKQITVNCTSLGKYIEESVEYLKLDIEGSETKVIKEIKDKLSRINHIFIEYHGGLEMEENSLGEILKNLEGAGFDYNIDKSLFYSKTKDKVMNSIGKKVSEIVWAKRING